MGGTRNLLMSQEAKEIWQFCLANQITVTAEYLPGTLKTRADNGFVFIQVVPPDPKVHKLGATSTCMDGQCISNKLNTPKGISLRSFCSYRESASQSNAGQVYVDHNNTSVVFAAMVHPCLYKIQFSFPHFQIFRQAQAGANTHCVGIKH